MPKPSDSRVTQALAAISAGDEGAVAELLPLVYDHLRSLARQRMAAEAPGHTLQATALVHEAYLRLLGEGQPAMDWECRGQFYAAAAEAMRRILVDEARRRHARKRGGGRQRVPLDGVEIAIEEPNIDLLALDKALDVLKSRDESLHEIVMLRYFGGLTEGQTARAIGVTDRTVRRHWAVARLWLRKEIDTAEREAGSDG
jgi:RNA polymerase sigma factor (TIGR02999 family)